MSPIATCNAFSALPNRTALVGKPRCMRSGSSTARRVATRPWLAACFLPSVVRAAIGLAAMGLAASTTSEFPMHTLSPAAVRCRTRAGREAEERQRVAGAAVPPCPPRIQVRFGRELRGCGRTLLLGWLVRTLGSCSHAGGAGAGRPGIIFCSPYSTVHMRHQYLPSAILSAVQLPACSFCGSCGTMRSSPTSRCGPGRRWRWGRPWRSL